MGIMGVQGATGKFPRGALCSLGIKGDSFADIGKRLDLQCVVDVEPEKIGEETPDHCRSLHNILEMHFVIFKFCL